MRGLGRVGLHPHPAIPHTMRQVARLVAMDSETFTPMADLATKWGVTANTVSRRLAFLGIKPERQGNYRYITAEQLALADNLHSHILSGKPMEQFPRPDQPEGGLVARQVRGGGQVAGQVEQVAALAAALAAAMPTPPADPLQRARGLAEAADSGLVLTTGDLAQLLGQGVGAWRDGHLAYGYQFNRHQQGRQVLWTVARVLGQSGTSRATSPTLTASPATSRPVGFLAPPEARAAITVQAVSLPSF
jgi:hypothetical protein